MPTPKNNSPQTEPPAYVKYFGLAFQMCAIIGLGTYLGYKLHEKSGMNFPLYLLIGCFLSIAIAFYQLFKSLKSEN
ncbi:Putative F0F1-ATPase subunit Ca2+/Mg2+ transporter [Cyclobacterium lianum]|uniref:Putative F0F1-ATPase subunit Ca2+/Mg2+ transporter n=1 Tax=Cyclobacterium lianum TaxID=388280 RepID=A0A1M7K9Q2_9BACT|nr:AtpZ/AtpI family protein [Cyclobacterium lianum]SHM61693.1 Putative F0F1-ATPase subunit Ca2+/Mg2+ transporter [Cyclobacterium lianum]